MNAVLTPEMRSLAAQFAGQQDFELDARGPRVFRVIGKTEDGVRYDETAEYSDGFAAVSAAIDAGVVGAVARPLSAIEAHYWRYPMAKADDERAMGLQMQAMHQGRMA